MKFRGILAAKSVIFQRFNQFITDRVIIVVFTVRNEVASVIFTGVCLSTWGGSLLPGGGAWSGGVMPGPGGWCLARGGLLWGALVSGGSAPGGAWSRGGGWYPSMH